MTLVIARKLKNVISFSSDSRIAFKSAGYIDFGIKIFSVPVKIYSPTDAASRKTQLLYDRQIGLAVVGSSINAYTVKDSLNEFLQYLQAIPGHTNLSFENIAKLAFKVYQKTTSELRQILGKDGFCQILFGGYCLETQKLRVFEFYPKEDDMPITLHSKEILMEDDILFYGSGKSVAKNVFDNNPKYNPLQVVRDVVKGKTVATVGGGLQYGEFQDSNFRIFGVTDYETFEDGSFRKYNDTLRGISIYREEFEREADGFHIAYSFKQPFQGEVNRLIDKFL